MYTRRLARLFGVATALVAALALLNTVGDVQLTGVDWSAPFGSVHVAP